LDALCFFSIFWYRPLPHVCVVLKAGAIDLVLEKMVERGGELVVLQCSGELSRWPKIGWQI
jgi:hypothetical protein